MAPIVLDAATAVEILVKAAAYVTCLAAAGSAFALLALSRLDDPTTRAVQRLAVGAAVVAAAFSALRIPVRASFLMGGTLSGAFDPAIVAMVAESPLGTSLWVRLAGLVLVCAAALNHRASPGRGRRRGGARVRLLRASRPCPGRAAAHPGRARDRAPHGTRLLDRRLRASAPDGPNGAAQGGRCRSGIRRESGLGRRRPRRCGRGALRRADRRPDRRNRHPLWPAAPQSSCASSHRFSVLRHTTSCASPLPSEPATRARHRNCAGRYASSSSWSLQSCSRPQRSPPSHRRERSRRSRCPGAIEARRPLPRGKAAPLGREGFRDRAHS